MREKISFETIANQPSVDSMESLFSYCSTRQFDSSGSSISRSSQDDGDDDYILLEKNLMGSLNDAMDDYQQEEQNFYQEQYDILSAQCERYQALIKRQEREITDYREDIEDLKEELIKIRLDYRQKIINYERTIISLREEIDWLRSSGGSALVIKEESQETISFSKSSIIDESSINFESNDKMIISSINELCKDPAQFKMNQVQFSQKDIYQLIDTVKDFCEENMTLKEEIESLRRQVNRLTVDNEEFRSLLWTTQEEPVQEKKKNKKVSTPIKNFIPYQALGPENFSFSVDEDYECDNLLSDENIYKHFTQKSTAVDTFELSKVKEMNISPIENEEMPSELPSLNQHHQQQANSNLESKFFFTDSMMKNVVMKNKSILMKDEISSIENEKLPPSFDSQSIVLSPSVSLVKLDSDDHHTEFLECQSNDENEETDVTLRNVTADEIRLMVPNNRSLLGGLPELLPLFKNIKKFIPGLRLFWFFLIIFLFSILPNYKPKLSAGGPAIYSLEELFFDIIEHYLRT